jgi:hypothetical protein
LQTHWDRQVRCRRGFLAQNQHRLRRLRAKQFHAQQPQECPVTGFDAAQAADIGLHQPEQADQVMPGRGVDPSGQGGINAGLGDELIEGTVIQLGQWQGNRSTTWRLTPFILSSVSFSSWSPNILGVRMIGTELLNNCLPKQWIWAA